MEAAQMNNDGCGDTALVEQNNRMCDDKKGPRNKVVAEAQGLGSSEEDESRTNGIARERNNGSDGAIQVPAGLQKPQPQGPAIHWERFLPTGTLKVLLVENDDSTRHVVSALLRNCSYEVTAVANGLQAWKILQDLTNHIDLVLTEVAMPVLSGVGLLCKIVSHKTLKNIPVIMMSSHDSMGLVFKCLSKGAVDFLVKPIRKNELKNLWQHVWRRCHSSSGSGSGSGSGSESGTQSKRPVKSISNDESETNSGSSDEHDDRSVGLSIQDGSDNGSGTQTFPILQRSWTKRAAEVDSSQPRSPSNQLADAPDSTCAQVIHTNPETFSSRWVHVCEMKDRPEQDEQVGLDSQLECCHKSSTQPGRKRQNNLFELDNMVFEKEQMEIKSENISQLRDCVTNLVGAVSSCTDRQVESRDLDTPSGLADTAQIMDSDARDFPSLALTMKTVKGVRDVETSMHDDHNVLRHSDLSAFSKYNPGFSANQGPTGNIGSCSPLDNKSVTLKTETMHNSNTTPPKQQSDESINNNDMASTTRYIPKLDALNNKSESTSAFNYSRFALQPVQNSHICPGKEVDVAVDNNQVQARESNQPFQVQHHHHHYHHHHHHVHKMKHQQQRGCDNMSLKTMAADSPQCGSSNMVGAPSEGNGGKYSVKGSGSGSNHGSNGQNGSDEGVAGNTQVTGVTGRNSDEDRFAQREAALIKFRQKRKERCFEKKVRYQSRKRLAEQRPRVRGQFVRQIGSDNKGRKDEQGNIKPDNNSCDSEQ